MPWRGAAGGKRGEPAAERVACCACHCAASRRPSASGSAACSAAARVTTPAGSESNSVSRAALRRGGGRADASLPSKRRSASASPIESPACMYVLPPATSPKALS
eukprot:scaffold127958_cov57-Phaeocystis_antarctica.AAC.2